MHKPDCVTLVGEIPRSLVEAIPPSIRNFYTTAAEVSVRQHDSGVRSITTEGVRESIVLTEVDEVLGLRRDVMRIKSSNPLGKVLCSPGYI